MLLTKKFVLVLVFLSLLCMSTACAADVSVDQTNTDFFTTDLSQENIIVGSELNNDGAVLGNSNNGTTRIVTQFTTEAIITAINESSDGDTILLLPDTYIGAKSIDVNKAVSIIGNNSSITLNKSYSEPLMKISVSNVQLKGITLFNCSCTMGPALTIRSLVGSQPSDIEIIDCNFINCTATSGLSEGGAVFIDYTCSNIHFLNCLF
ncbi:MAG: hypothetical protein MJ209_01510 [archaeon]|nr:hypothetical protein [archaeon]